MATKEQTAKVRTYTPIVQRIAGGFIRKLPPNVLLDDLVAAGMIGLWDAILKHSDDGDNFEWYVRIRIRGAILDELRAQDWLPRRTRWLVDAENPIEVESVGDTSSLCLDQEDTCSMEDMLDACRKNRSLLNALAQLPEREREIITQHDFNHIKLKDLADQMSLSEPRVSQLRTRALAQLNKLLEAA